MAIENFVNEVVMFRHRLQDAVSSSGMALNLGIFFFLVSRVSASCSFRMSDVGFCGASHLAHAITALIGFTA